VPWRHFGVLPSNRLQWSDEALSTSRLPLVEDPPKISPLGRGHDPQADRSFANGIPNARTAVRRDDAALRFSVGCIPISFQMPIAAAFI
jgi:hypothetical protein